MTTCHDDRVETGPYFVPGLPHVVALSRSASGCCFGRVSEALLLAGRTEEALAYADAQVYRGMQKAHAHVVQRLSLGP